MSKHGGKRPGAGRPKGSKTRAGTLDRQNLLLQAREHGRLALDVLADIAENSTSDSARISAAAQILDRGFGRPGAMSDMRTPEEVKADEAPRKDPWAEAWRKVMNQTPEDVIATSKPRREGVQPDMFDSARGD